MDLTARVTQFLPLIRKRSFGITRRFSRGRFRCNAAFTHEDVAQETVLLLLEKGKMPPEFYEHDRYAATCCIRATRDAFKRIITSNRLLAQEPKNVLVEGHEERCIAMLPCVPEDNDPAIAAQLKELTNRFFVLAGEEYRETAEDMMGGLAVRRHTKIDAKEPMRRRKVREQVILDPVFQDEFPDAVFGHVDAKKMTPCEICGDPFIKRNANRSTCSVRCSADLKRQRAAELKSA